MVIMPLWWVSTTVYIAFLFILTIAMLSYWYYLTSCTWLFTQCEPETWLDIRIHICLELFKSLEIVKIEVFSHVGETCKMGRKKGPAKSSNEVSSSKAASSKVVTSEPREEENASDMEGKSFFSLNENYN